MKQSEKIKESIYEELNEFEKKFFDSMSSNISLLNRISYFIVNKKGKQLRPILVFLCAKLINEKVNEKTYRGAAVVELIHTATLVHDDVIDDSNQRRGFFSINALWKNKIAVLFGDYLLSKGLLLCINNNDFDLLKIISEAVKEMSEGEILQIQKSRDLNINESDYYEIIRKKTASLIISCCRMGVQSVSDNKKNIKLITSFALNTGMAFQIKDDLFDYSDQKIGKPVGIDIREKKITLPSFGFTNLILESSFSLRNLNLSSLWKKNSLGELSDET